MNKYIVEFIGTFFLMLIIMLAVHHGPSAMAPMAISIGLVALVYMGGPISAAHYNPAVSVAFFAEGDFSLRDLIPYLLSQILAAILAVWIAGYLLQHSPEASMPSLATRTLLPTLVAEILGTFLLMYVILQVAVPKAVQGNDYYGIAIGFTVGGLAYALGPVSGAALNPAVAIGFCVAGMHAWTDLWIYLLGEIVGGLLAVGVFRLGGQ